jgi:hypothetical protein
MQRRIHFLDSFAVVDSQGHRHKVRLFEHQVQPDMLLCDGHEHWEPTGQAEYRLDNGDIVEVLDDGTMRARDSSLQLWRRDA